MRSFLVTWCTCAYCVSHLIEACMQHVTAFNFEHVKELCSYSFTDYVAMADFFFHAIIDIHFLKMQFESKVDYNFFVRKKHTSIIRGYVRGETKLLVVTTHAHSQNDYIDG